MDYPARNDAKMRRRRLPRGCELAATAAPHGSRFRECGIGRERIGAEGGARRRRHPGARLKGVPLRRAKGNGERDDEIGQARGEAHDTHSIASQQPLSWTRGISRAASSRLKKTPVSRDRAELNAEGGAAGSQA